jgi:hypothetical protein
MTTLPGFGADSSVGADRSVRPAQSSAPGAVVLNFISRHRSGEPLLVVPDCPAGLRPVLVTECVTSLPVFECEWLNSAGAYDCWIKRWQCIESRTVWQCQLPTLKVVG